MCDDGGGGRSSGSFRERIIERARDARPGGEETVVRGSSGAATKVKGAHLPARGNFAAYRPTGKWKQIAFFLPSSR